MNTQELNQKLIALQINPTFYSLDGRIVVGQVLEKKDNNLFLVYSVDDRGGQYNKHEFAKEEEACEYLYNFFLKYPEN